MNRSPVAAAVLSGIAVALVVLAMRALGVLQAPELGLYDQFLRALPQPPGPDPRILVLQITEEHIQELGHWPLSDETLARALGRLVSAEARVIGLDIYRDLPVPPGERRLATLLKRESSTIAARQMGDVHSRGIPGQRARGFQ